MICGVLEKYFILLSFFTIFANLNFLFSPARVDGNLLLSNCEFNKIILDDMCGNSIKDIHVR